MVLTIVAVDSTGKVLDNSNLGRADNQFRLSNGICYPVPIDCGRVSCAFGLELLEIMVIAMAMAMVLVIVIIVLDVLRQVGWLRQCQHLASTDFEPCTSPSFHRPRGF
jgi:hypothetical protein